MRPGGAVGCFLFVRLHVGLKPLGKGVGLCLGRRRGGGDDAVKLGCGGEGTSGDGGHVGGQVEAVGGQSFGIGEEGGAVSGVEHVVHSLEGGVAVCHGEALQCRAAFERRRVEVGEDGGEIDACGDGGEEGADVVEGDAAVILRLRVSLCVGHRHIDGLCFAVIVKVHGELGTHGEVAGVFPAFTAVHLDDEFACFSQIELKSAGVVRVQCASAGGEETGAMGVVGAAVVLHVEMHVPFSVACERLLGIEFYIRGSCSRQAQRLLRRADGGEGGGEMEGG